MKIMPINKISFKASLCTNFDFKDKKSNFWPGLVDYAKTNRREEVLEKLEGLLQDVYENTDDDIILALEKYENRLTPLYILAAYDNEEKIIKDRKIYTKNCFDDCVGRIKDLNSISKEQLKGKIIVFPTDTVYGVGALYNDIEGIEKIYEMRTFIQAKLFLEFYVEL